MPHRDAPPGNRRLAKNMRRAMPEAELRLWRHIRKPGIGGLRFRRQVPIGDYIVDFFCPAHRLIVELDGGQHLGAAHQANDAVRDTWLRERGYTVLRIWNNDVMSDLDAVADAILKAATP